MRIEELYQDIIITVCNVTGIDEADILHKDMPCNLWCGGFAFNPDSQRTGRGEPLRMQLPPAVNRTKRVRRKKR